MNFYCSGSGRPHTRPGYLPFLPAITIYLGKLNRLSRKPARAFASVPILPAHIHILLNRSSASIGSQMPKKFSRKRSSGGSIIGCFTSSCTNLPSSTATRQECSGKLTGGAGNRKNTSRSTGKPARRPSRGDGGRRRAFREARLR